MKKWGFICISLIVAIFVLGCGGAPASNGQPYSDPNSPPWINEIAPEDVIWGIGAAKQSSVQMSRTRAESQARTAIARTIQTSVDAMITDYRRDAGTTGNTVNLDLFEDIQRQVTSIKLNGARANQWWTGPDGNVWCRVEYKLSDAKAAISEVFDSEAARYSEFKAEEALRKMDGLLDRDKKPEVIRE